MVTKLKSSAAVATKCFLFLVIFLGSKTILVCNSDRSLIKANSIVMTSVRCFVLDPIYAKFYKCSLKALNRTHKFVSIHAFLIKRFTNPIMVHFQVLKKANGGFKPFGIDVTLDGCKYMEGKRNMVFDWIFDIIFPYTNINHTCPYQDDIIFQMPIKPVKFPSVFPDGDYRFELKFATRNQMKLGGMAYLTLKEIDLVE